MKRTEYIHGMGVVKFDAKKVKINWSNLFIILYMIITGVAGIIGTYMYVKIDRRVDNVELFQGPAVETEWRLRGGKVCLMQSECTMQIVP